MTQKLAESFFTGMILKLRKQLDNVIYVKKITEFRQN